MPHDPWPDSWDTLHAALTARPRRCEVSSSGLEDSRVIVTGAESGIGRAAVLRFAHEGAMVVAIVFLASDAASKINGVVLAVDNGWSAV